MNSSKYTNFAICLYFNGLLLVHSTRLLPPEFNLCRQRSRLRLDICAPRGRYIDSFALMDQTLTSTIEAYEENHIRCENTRQTLRNLTIQSFMHVDEPETAIQHPVSATYYSIGRLTYLLTILKSEQADECCLGNREMYRTFKHRILSKWHSLNDCYGESLSEDVCIVAGHMNMDMDCTDLRDAIYTILRYVKTEFSSTIPILLTATIE